LAAMPEVEMAAISSNATPPANGEDAKIEIMGRSNAEKPEVRMNFVSAEYFPLLHIPLAQGRLWEHPEAMRGAPLVVINETMAKQFWPNGGAIGQELRSTDLKDGAAFVVNAPGISGNGWLQIIGVVADKLDDGLRKPIKPEMYLPFTAQMWMFTQILVRTRIPPLSLLRDIRAQVVQVDADQQVLGNVQDLEGWIHQMPEYGQQRLVAILFGIFSVLALALATVGLYSVVSYGVATRTNEFGIRMALGAKAGDVFRLVLSATAVNVGAGLVAGILLCVAFNRLATKWVSESSRDPLILGIVTAVLVGAAALACFVPARRASAVDPMEALRYE
jgi:hypothetical protein